MSTRHMVRVVTFNGKKQNLAIECDIDVTRSIRQYQLTPDGKNTTPCYEGDDKLTTENWGTFLPPGDGGFPPPPYISPEIDDDRLLLSDVFVLGKSGEKVHVKIFF